MENNTDHSEQNNFSPIAVQDVDVDFLPIVYEIIRSVERDFHDNTAKARESQDCSQKVLELQKKFEVARAQNMGLPKKKVKAIAHYAGPIQVGKLLVKSRHYFQDMQIKRLPGIDYNKQDQIKQFEILRTQLRLKQELLQKYRNMCSFETSFK